jgi:hypothetical protein
MFLDQHDSGFSEAPGAQDLKVAELQEEVNELKVRPRTAKK